MVTLFSLCSNILGAQMDANFKADKNFTGSTRQQTCKSVSRIARGYDMQGILIER